MSSTRSVKVTWSHPNERENGDYLELSEIGGYEIRYKKPATGYSYINLPGNDITEYNLSNYDDTMLVEIAVYDTSGLYSEFVPVTQ